MPRSILQLANSRPKLGFDGTPFQHLQAILEEQLAAAPDGKVAVIASTIYESEPDALAPFVKDRTIRWLCGLLRKKRAAASQDAQLPLPGYEHIPAIISNKRGDQKLLDANATDLRQYRAKLFAGKWRNSARVRELRELLALLKGKKRGTTVRQALKLEGG